MKREFITIQRENGPQEIEAEMYTDDLAIHHSLTPRHGKWVLTHVLSGHVVISGETRGEVLEWAKELKDFDWNWSKPSKAPDATRAAVEHVREAMKKQREREWKS